MKKIVFIALVALMAACSPAKHNSSTSNNSTQVSAGQADGSSFDNAIIINEKGERAGVAAEYKWLREHYPGYKSKSQSLQSNNKKPYDVLSITTADGTAKKVYFDISSFFGKF